MWRAVLPFRHHIFAYGAAPVSCCVRIAGSSLRRRKMMGHAATIDRAIACSRLRDFLPAREPTRTCCWAVRHRIVSKMVRRCPPIPGGRNAIVLLPYARDMVLQPQLPALESRSAVRESAASSSARRTRQLRRSAPFGSRSDPTVYLGRWATPHYHCAI